MTDDTELSGQLVLVVENDYYLATDTLRALEEAGAEVAGPCATETAARAELERRHPNAVILDINLGSGPSFDLAEHLTAKGIRFAFMTGYDARIIPKQFGDVVRLVKPVDPRAVIDTVSRLVHH